jgi:hypothetical protein
MLFLGYRNSKCGVQRVGIHTIGGMPKQDPDKYTGHSFRRTSAMPLANTGADLAVLKRQGAWKSSSVAEKYIDFLESKNKIARMVLNGETFVEVSRDQSKSSLVFMDNIPLDKVIEQIRTINSTNYIVQVAKKLRKEILSTERIPDGYLCDEILIEQFKKKSQLPHIWQSFMQALFSAKNIKLSENYNRRALSLSNRLQSIYLFIYTSIPKNIV